jgi:hypothetical protein
VGSGVFNSSRYKISPMLSKKLMGFKEILKIDIAWGPAKIGHACRN